MHQDLSICLCCCSVLDGEGSECLERLESSADLAHSLSVWGRAVAGSAAATSTSTARQLLRHCFGRHRHSLVCRTRVEVCSIPMHVLFLMPAPAVLEKSRVLIYIHTYIHTHTSTAYMHAYKQYMFFRVYVC